MTLNIKKFKRLLKKKPKPVYDANEAFQTLQFWANKYESEIFKRLESEALNLFSHYNDTTETL